MQTANITDSAEPQTYHDAVHARADVILQKAIYTLFFIGLALSLFHETYGLAVAVGGLSVGAYWLISSVVKNKLWVRLSVGLLLWNFALQFFWQMQGTYEMYFFYFAGLTLLLFYEDWRVFVPVVIYACLSYLFLFTYAHPSSEVHASLASMPALTYTNMAIHFALFTGYAFICGYWAITKKEQTQKLAEGLTGMQRQLAQMDINIGFANSLSEGNLSAEYSADSADRMGSALMNMRDSLAEAAERESKEKFVNVGLASIGDILRKNSDNIEDLCDEVIQNLVKYMKANQGGVFIIHKEEDSKVPYLKLMACRAYERKKYIDKRIEMGQGLAGQVAYEKKTIMLTEVPDSYVNITSGLGVANPNCILIIPLKANEELVGVLELASFDRFNDNDIEFLEKVGESIAATVISVQTNQQTKELLEQSRQMTEQMQSQEEEMRQNMEEMQATQEEMVRAQRELAEKEMNLDALVNNTTDSIITIDRNYRILIMNKVIKDRYKGTKREGIKVGDNVLAGLGADRDEWKGYYDRALGGERLDVVLKSLVAGEDTYRQYFINPLKDEKGDVLGVSVFSKDVTEKRAMEITMNEKSSVLNAMVNNTDNTYFAMDSSYRIIFVNDTLRERFKADGKDLKRGMNILDILSGEALKIWKGRYDKILAGESLSFRENRQVRDKTLRIITQCFPVKDDEGAITGVAVISKDITEEEKAKEQLARLTAEIEKLRGISNSASFGSVSGN